MLPSANFSLLTIGAGVGFGLRICTIKPDGVCSFHEMRVNIIFSVHFSGFVSYLQSASKGAEEKQEGRHQNTKKGN